MCKNLLFWVLATLLSVGYAANPNTVSQIVIDGNIDVNIIAGSATEEVHFLGTRERLDHVSESVKKGVLHIHDDEDAPAHEGHLLATIKVGQVNKIHFSGQGDLKASGINTRRLDIMINAKGRAHFHGPCVGLQYLTLKGGAIVHVHNIKSPQLTIKAEGSNIVRLRGVANLRRLTMSGEGAIDARWVDSPLLTVLAHDNAQAKLAGKVGTLEMTLFDNTHVDAHYLRAKKAFVKTNNSAIAHIQVVDEQQTLAKGYSNIYYYKRPRYKRNHMHGSGAVLNLNGMS